MKTLLKLIPFTLALFSCSQQPKSTFKIKERFITYISSDGVKNFSYSLENSASGQLSRKPGKRSRGGKRKGAIKHDMQRNSKAQLKQLLMDKFEKTLFESSYCRDGYIKTETHLERGFSQIKGHCEEKASGKDRVRFPNKE